MAGISNAPGGGLSSGRGQGYCRGIRKGRKGFADFTLIMPPISAIPWSRGLCTNLPHRNPLRGWASGRCTPSRRRRRRFPAAASAALDQELHLLPKFTWPAFAALPPSEGKGGKTLQRRWCLGQGHAKPGDVLCLFFFGHKIASALVFTEVIYLFQFLPTCSNMPVKARLQPCGRKWAPICCRFFRSSGRGQWRQGCTGRAYRAGWGSIYIMAYCQMVQEK